MPPLHVFPLPEGSLNALPRVLRAPETDQPHLRANASIAAPTPFNGMGGEGSLSGGGCGVFQSLHFAKPVIDLYATVACISTARRVTECSASRFASTGD